MVALSSQRLIEFSMRRGTRPARFFLVGLTGVGVSSLVLWVTVHWIGLPPAIGAICASVIATFTNFLLNDAFTWRDRRSPSLKVKAIRLLRYYAATAGGNLIYVAVFTALVQWLRVHVLVANIVAIGVGGSLNYVVHNYWTWRHHAAKQW